MASAEEHPASSSDNAPDAAADPDVPSDAVTQRRSARVAMQVSGGRYILLESRNDATRSGEQAMRQIRQDYNRAVADAKPRWLPCSPFRKPAVYIGTMSIVSDHRCRCHQPTGGTQWFG